MTDRRRADDGGPGWAWGLLFAVVVSERLLFNFALLSLKERSKLEIISKKIRDGFAADAASALLLKRGGASASRKMRHRRQPGRPAHGGRRQRRESPGDEGAPKRNVPGPGGLRAVRENQLAKRCDAAMIDFVPCLQPPPSCS